jgi:hypothetical protein
LLVLAAWRASITHVARRPGGERRPYHVQQTHFLQGDARMPW